MYGLLKRALDIVASLTAILLLLPLAVPLVVALRLTGEGKVFYRQERVGRAGRPFGMLKFATMLEDSLNMPGGGFTAHNDPRLTPMGGFLRLSKINELPQLWNVLRGDMTIVGPRPLPRASFDNYASEVRAALVHLRPGVTGIASLVFRDEERLIAASGQSPAKFYVEVLQPFKGQLELWYHERRSIGVDLAIIILTAVSIVMPSQGLVHRVFPDLPAPPAALART